LATTAWEYGPAGSGAILRFCGFFGLLVSRLGWRFGELDPILYPEVVQHLPDNRGRELETQGETFGSSEHRVIVVRFPLFEHAQGDEDTRDLRGRHEGIATRCHAQVLDKRQVDARDHTGDRLRLVDAPPDKEASVVGVGPALKDLGLAHVVVLGDPVLELAEELSC